MNNKLLDFNNNVLLCDGAMGTMIQKTGVLKPGDSPELLNLTHPELISTIHQSYIQVGSQYIGSNTFGGNRLKLEAHGLVDEKVREVNYSGVKIAKEAAQSTGALVAASLGSTGKMIEPLGELSFEAAFETFREQCTIFAEAGADLVAVETMSDIQETKAAILAALEVNLPVFASVSFMDNGRILTGQTPEMVAATLSGFPLLALGTNCGLSASLLKSIVLKLLAYSQKPVVVQPNAGKPSLLGNETLYLESPSEYANACLELVRSGVRIIGGCCGTTPEHIKLLKALLDHEKFDLFQPSIDDYLVGKSSVANMTSICDQAAVWRFRLRQGEPLWDEICHGNSEPMIDQLLEIDPNQYRIIELDGLSLSEMEFDSFRELISVVTTYWPNPISAKLNSGSLIKTLLTRNSGRSLVITASENTELIKNISKFGGVFQAAK
jgi:5-methyltetrahydrofolate--homocysteine methyltransferase